MLVHSKAYVLLMVLVSVNVMEKEKQRRRGKENRVHLVTSEAIDLVLCTRGIGYGSKRTVSYHGEQILGA